MSEATRLNDFAVETRYDEAEPEIDAQTALRLGEPSPSPKNS
ncbi:MAG: hypothetical protein RMM16_10660 [Chloroherpetonaceae bacterium]|nr:hypothetical protein [Chloroherpetonaceae bacterium]